MTETLDEQKSPVQRVFGDAFSLAVGAADEETQDAYFEAREAEITARETTWVARTFGWDHGVVADLYRNGEPVATLDFEHGTQLASVYTISPGGKYVDTALCNEAAFNEAVVAAEEFAASQDQEA